MAVLVISGSHLPICRMDEDLAALFITNSVSPNLPHDAQIVIVEGVLRADVLSALRPDLHIVSDSL